MIPLRDTIRSRTTPVVNYLFIALSVVVFVFQLTLGAEASHRLLMSFAVIPGSLHSTILDGQLSLQPLFSLVSSIFLHGGWGHLLGNMIYLYVFGDNVEDRLGHSGYFVFYLLAGSFAALIESFIQGPSMVPLIGASGAIAGVLGAYFLLFPRSRVLTLVPLFVLFPIIEVSAWFFLGFWLLIQFIQGGLSLGGSEGGIAWWAHAGGFLAGAAMLPLFLLVRRIKS